MPFELYGDGIPDAEIDALLNEPILDDEGNELPSTTVVADVPPVVVKAEPAAPLKLDIPPELLAQGGALAAQVQAFLSGNAVTQKAILDKLTGPAPTHETADERQARAQKIFNDFVLDPEKVLEDFASRKGLLKSGGISAAEIEAVQGPAFQAMGEKRVDDFLREMRDDPELKFDADLTRAVEKEFRAFADSQTKKSGVAFERYIGQASREDARDTLENVYQRAVGRKSISDTRELRKTQSPLSIAGRGAAGESGVTGISAKALEIAKETAKGLAMDDDGKIDPEAYKSYLKIALGR